MRKTVIAAIAVTIPLLLAPSSGWAQNLASQPGYVPIEKLDLFPREKLSVEINVEGALLGLIAAAARGSDPEFASLVSGLKAINVQAFPLKGVDEDRLRTRIGSAVRWLEDRGWKSTLKVREGGEETYIYLKEADGKIAGLTLLSMTPGDEAVVLNIVGRIDPAQIGRLARHFDVDVKVKPSSPPPPKNDKKPE